MKNLKKLFNNMFNNKRRLSHGRHSMMIFTSIKAFMELEKEMMEKGYIDKQYNLMPGNKQKLASLIRILWKNKLVKETINGRKVKIKFLKDYFEDRYDIKFSEQANRNNREKEDLVLMELPSLKHWIVERKLTGTPRKSEPSTK